jgi:hypothetical protein
MVGSGPSSAGGVEPAGSDFFFRDDMMGSRATLYRAKRENWRDRRTRDGVNLLSMSDPVLQREAEVPRTRSTGGAIVVAVAFFSLFTALGASAFVIRVRSLATRGCPQAMAAPAPILAIEPVAVPAVLTSSNAPVAVELLSREEAISRAERQLTDEERENVARFRNAARRGDAEVALLIYNDFGSASPARYVLESERNQLADDWLATQLARLDRELDARDCGAVNERIERISRLVPDRHLPSRMACK